MFHLKIKEISRNPVHVRFKVYAVMSDIEDPTRALSGELCMRVDEFQAFHELLMRGACAPLHDWMTEAAVVDTEHIKGACGG